MVQDKLRIIAKSQLRTQRTTHSLQATLLIDDVFMHLMGKSQRITWHDRQHFYRTAARAMRNMLVDYERRRRAQRRGGDRQRVEIDPSGLPARSPDMMADLLDLDDALDRLGRIDSRQRDIVELHHFGGYSLSETAEVLSLSLTTVKTDWRLAKAWLYRELSKNNASE